MTEPNIILVVVFMVWTLFVYYIGYKVGQVSERVEAIIKRIKEKFGIKVE